MNADTPGEEVIGERLLKKELKRFWREDALGQPGRKILEVDLKAGRKASFALQTELTWERD